MNAVIKVTQQVSGPTETPLQTKPLYLGTRYIASFGTSKHGSYITLQDSWLPIFVLESPEELQALINPAQEEQR